MKKSIKIILITALILCAIGTVLIGIGFMTGDRNELHTTIDNLHVYSQEKTPLDASVTTINADLVYCDFTIKASDDDRYYIAYHIDSQSNTTPFSYTIDGDTLRLHESEKEGLYVHYTLPTLLSPLLSGDDAQNIDDIGSNITLYVPKDALKALNCQMKYGDLYLRDSNLGNVTAHLSYGDIDLTHCQWASASINLKYGDIDCTTLDCKGMTQLSTDYGDVALTDSVPSDDLSIQIFTKYGDLDVNPDLYGTFTQSDDDDDGAGYERLSPIGRDVLTIKSEYGDISLQ